MPMFFRKPKTPNLTDLLVDSVGQFYKNFEKTVFKTEMLTPEQKTELAVYLLFFHIHAMLMREVPNDIVLAFPTNENILPMLTNNEKENLAEKYHKRMQGYAEALTSTNDKDSVLNVAVLFLTHFYNESKEQIASQKLPQLMASELLSKGGLESATEYIDLCTKHNQIR